jgi:hypothetical protein
VLLKTNNRCSLRTTHGSVIVLVLSFSIITVVFFIIQSLVSAVVYGIVFSYRRLSLSLVTGL